MNSCNLYLFTVACVEERFPSDIDGSGTMSEDRSCNDNDSSIWSSMIDNIN